jgi:serine protease AprX
MPLFLRYRFPPQRAGCGSKRSLCSPDRSLTAKLDNTAAAVNASVVWKAGYNGSGIGVAVLDSGINSDVNLGGGLLGLGSRVVYSQDFLGGNGQDA